MSLKISSVPINARGPSGKNSVQLRASGSKGVRDSERNSVSSAIGHENLKPTQEQLRYEISSLSRKSVELQKDVSDRQSTAEVLEDFHDLLEDLKHSPSETSMSRLRSFVEDNSEVFRGQANGSSNDKIEPVTVSRPPKIGAYSIAIFTGQTRHPESVSYTIKLVDEENIQKTVTASVSPLSGLIEGVELYFETDNDATPMMAELSIADEESRKIEVPTFSKDLERLEVSLPDAAEFDRQLNQTGQKLDSIRKGVHDDLNKTRQQFITLNSTQENLRATDADSRSVITAFVALDNLKEEIKNFSETDKLFNSHDLTQAKSLLD